MELRKHLIWAGIGLFFVFCLWNLPTAGSGWITLGCGIILPFISLFAAWHILAAFFSTISIQFWKFAPEWLKYIKIFHKKELSRMKNNLWYIFIAILGIIAPILGFESGSIQMDKIGPIVCCIVFGFAVTDIIHVVGNIKRKMPHNNQPREEV